MVAGCEDAGGFPKVILKRLLKLVKAHQSCLSSQLLITLAGRAAKYQKLRAGPPFYIADNEEPWGQLVVAIEKARSAVRPGLKRPAASRTNARARKRMRRSGVPTSA